MQKSHLGGSNKFILLLAGPKLQGPILEHPDKDWSPSDSAVRNPPAVQETEEMRVWSLRQEDPMEEEMTTYSNILAREFPWTEEPGGQQSIEGVTQSWTWLSTHTHTHTHVLVKEPQVRQIPDNRYEILVDRKWIKKHNLDLITSLCYPMQLPLSTWDYFNDN